VKFGDLVQELDARKYHHRQKEVSWQSFSDKYLAYSQTNKKSQTYDRDVITLRILNRLFPLKSPESLTPALMEEYKTRRKLNGIKESTINRDLGLFKAMAGKANEWGYLMDNPLRVVKKLKIGRNRPGFFSKEEVRAILDNTIDQFERVMVMVGIYTGMRRDEVCHLTWDDVDWNKKVIRIVGRDGWTPKDYEAREIPIHPELVKILSKWQKENGTAAHLLSLQDQMPNGAYLGKLFKRILRRAGVKGNFHTMRHTYASHLVNANVDLYTVSKLLGHASIKTTEIYAHLQQSSLHNAVLRLTYVVRHT